MRQLGGQLIVLLLLASSSQAATQYAASNGFDSATCGSQTDPCRSIGQAIAHASAGDSIVVGPGAYGDLTANGDYLAPGEEPGGAACGGTRGLICVDKALTIESSHGAQTTFLQETLGVRLLASGTVFGSQGKGFTLTGGAGMAFAAGTTGSQAVDNAFSLGSIDMQGSGHTFAHNLLGPEASVVVSGTGQTVDNNRIFADSIGNGGGSGIDVAGGTGHSVTNNVIVGKAAGVTVHGGATDVVVQGNSTIGNDYGLVAGDIGSGFSVHGNNIFGNGVVDPTYCGFLNQSETAVDATDNYWGAPSGPGPDPADDFCDEGASATIAIPFSTTPFPIPTPNGGGGGGNGDPVCTAAQAAPQTLWPANNKFVHVSIVGVGDPDNDPVAILVTGVTQDEPVSSGPDAVIPGSGGTGADIRAQRLGSGNGRVYELAFSASDGNGGSCTGSVTVGVPKSQSQTIVDDGQNYDSTQP